MSGRLRPFHPVPYGRYTLVAPLAVGGMGEVYLAKASFPGGLEKLCVIKKILPHLAEDPEFVARFLDEARVLIQLQHGSIAQVFETGLHGKESFIALEFVDGKDLRRVMHRAAERGERLPVELSVFVALRILEALAYAHRRRNERGVELGLVHRDMSPQNVLVSYEGEVKVIDFGLARSHLSAQRTRPSVILGKFHYMAPEQARGGRLDRRTDLYALGLILRELLTGRNPFEDVPPPDLLAAVAEPSFPPLAQSADVPPALAAAVDRALRVDPAGRFASAEEMRAGLAALIPGLRPDVGPDQLAVWLRDRFHAEYEGERRLIAQVAGLLPAEVLAPEGAATGRTEALIDTLEGEDEAAARVSQRPQHVLDTHRFDPESTPGPSHAPQWFAAPGSMPEAERSPDMPWPGEGAQAETMRVQVLETAPELTPVRPIAALPRRAQAAAAHPEALAGTPGGRREATPGPASGDPHTAATRPAPYHVGLRAASLRARSWLPGLALLLLAGGAVALGLWFRAPSGGPGAAPVPAMPATSAPPADAGREAPAAGVRAGTGDAARSPPVPATPAGTRTPAAHTAPPAPAAPRTRRGPDDGPRAELLRHRDRLDALYDELVARHGADKVGAIVVSSKRAVDSSFDRLIESPDRYDELERQLSDLERILEERRSSFR